MKLLGDLVRVPNLYASFFFLSVEIVSARSESSEVVQIHPSHRHAPASPTPLFDAAVKEENELQQAMNFATPFFVFDVVTKCDL